MSLRAQQRPCLHTTPAALHISGASPALGTKTSESVSPSDPLTPVSGSPHPLPREFNKQNNTGNKICPVNCPTGSLSEWRRASRNEGRPLWPSVPGPRQPLHVGPRAPWAPSGASVGHLSARPYVGPSCTHFSDMSVVTSGRDQNSTRVRDLILPSWDHSRSPSTSAVPPGEGSTRDPPDTVLHLSCLPTPAVSILEPSHRPATC